MEESKLPAGWRLTKLGAIVKIGSRNVDPSSEPDRIWNYVALENVEQGTGRLVDFAPTLGKEIGSTKARFQKGDVLYGKLRPYLRKAWVAEFDGCSSTDLIPLAPGDDILAEYLKWFLLSPLHMEYIMPLMAGIRMPRLRSDDLFNMPIPLPPVGEQRRIVTRVEEKMDRSRRARGALSSVEVDLSRLRLSLLHEAFHPAVGPEDMSVTSPINEDDRWRLPRGWAWQQFADVAKVASNLVDPAAYAALPHIAPNHIESGTGKLLQYQTAQEDGVTSPKHLFNTGDILYSKIRPYLNKATLVDFQGICSADMYPIRTSLHAPYLWYWLLSPQFVHWASQSQGRTVLPKINQAALAKILVPVPPSATQVEIANKLHTAFVSLDQQRGQVETASQALQALESAFLTDAFHGY